MGGAHRKMLRSCRRWRLPPRFAPQEVTPSNLSLLRPRLIAAGYRPPFEQPVDQRGEALGFDVSLVEVEQLQLAARRGEGAAEWREDGHCRRRDVREWRP